jgi:4-amino-4-deoxy-L-arabinose transferase-like glycosyltransferase
MGAGSAAAGAVMTKGLVGFIFPLLIWVPWLILSGRLGRLKDKWWWRGLGLTLCLLIPWHMWILHRYPEFAKFYFWHEHFERYLTPAHHRSKFLFFIPLSFLMGFFPWILFLPRAWCRFSTTHSPERERLRYATLWGGGIVLFFTFSNSQLIPYVLPAIPPAALWVGWALSQRGPTLFKSELQLAGLLYMMAAFLAPLAMAHKKVTAIPLGLSLGLEGLLFGGGLSILWLARKEPRRAFHVFFTIIFIFCLLCPNLMPYFQRPGTKSFARYILQREKTDYDAYVAYDYFQDFPFYLNRTVGIIDHVPDEQGFGVRLALPSRYVSMARFAERWKQETPVYVLVSRTLENTFKQALNLSHSYAVMQDAHFVLFRNHS